MKNKTTEKGRVNDNLNLLVRLERIMTKRELVDRIKNMPDNATISVGDSERKHDDPDQIDVDLELNEIFIWKYWDDD